MCPRVSSLRIEVNLSRAPFQINFRNRRGIFHRSAFTDDLFHLLLGTFFNFSNEP